MTLLIAQGEAKPCATSKSGGVTPAIRPLLATAGSTNPSRHCIEYREHFVRALFPAEVSGPLQAARNHRAPQLRVTERGPQPGRDRPDVVRIDEVTRAGEDLRWRAGVGSQDRAAAGHRLDQRNPEPLVQGGKCEQLRQAVDGRQVRMRDPAEEPDAVLETERADFRELPARAPALLPGDPQLLGKLARDLGKRP